MHPEYHLGCSKMGPFPDDGSAQHAQYFTKGVKTASCDLVSFPTAYSLYNRNDYKRCVCETWYPDTEDCIKGDRKQKEEKQKKKSDEPERKDSDKLTLED